MGGVVSGSGNGVSVHLLPDTNGDAVGDIAVATYTDGAWATLILSGATGDELARLPGHALVDAVRLDAQAMPALLTMETMVARYRAVVQVQDRSGQWARAETAFEVVASPCPAPE